MSLVPDFFRTFVYGEQKSTLPLSMARVALSESDPMFIVMCSDGQLRSFDLGRLAPRSVFPVVDHAVDKALVRVLQIEANKFTFLIYVAGEDRSCFKECLFDSVAASLEVTTHIPDPQLPLIDMRVSEAHLWALWRTADGYMLRHWPLSTFVDAVVVVVVVVVCCKGAEALRDRLGSGRHGLGDLEPHPQPQRRRGRV